MTDDGPAVALMQAWVDARVASFVS